MTNNPKSELARALTAELLILPDGKILVHNLTQSLAELLRELNPSDPQIAPRSRRKTTLTTKNTK